MNKAILVGRLTKDPELRNSGEKSVVKFSIAINRNYKNERGEYDADFINCIAFGKTSEFIAKYFQKGNLIGITGRIQTGSYKNRDGVKVYTTDVMVESTEFINGKKSDDSSKSYSNNERDEPDDDEYPF